MIAGIWISLGRERKGAANWRRPVWTAFFGICTYIFANGILSGIAESRTAKLVEEVYEIKPTLVVANPVLLQFWKRQMLWRFGDRYGVAHASGDYTIFKGARLIENRHHYGPVYVTVRTPGEDKPWIGTTSQLDGPAVDYFVQTNADVRAFLFWSRMPFGGVGYGKNETSIVLYDQRFWGSPVGDRFKVEAKVSKEVP